MSLALPMLEAEARRVAGEIGGSLPDGVGFTLLLFNFGEANDPNSFTTYISSAERETMIATLEELLGKWKSEGTAMAPVIVQSSKARKKWKFGLKGDHR